MRVRLTPLTLELSPLYTAYFSPLLTAGSKGRIVRRNHPRTRQEALSPVLALEAMATSNYLTLAFVRELITALESSTMAYRSLPSDPAIRIKPRDMLRPLIVVLCFLMEMSYDHPDIDFTSLELPLRECRETCDSLNVSHRPTEGVLLKLACYVSVLNIAIVNADL